MTDDHDNLVTDEAKFLKKKMAARICVQGAWIKPKMKFFIIFLILDHYVFLKLDTVIACNSV